MARFGSRPVRVVIGVGALGCAAVATAIAAGPTNHSATLVGFNEVPVVSSTGSGEFAAREAPGGDAIDWRLSYRDLEGNPVQSHIHLGQKGVNGGIAVWLCSNLASPPTPPGVQPCPPSGTIDGSFTAADIVGPAAQGLTTGELAELREALDAGVAYVNVHTTKHPPGEIRGAMRPGAAGH